MSDDEEPEITVLLDENGEPYAKRYSWCGGARVVLTLLRPVRKSAIDAALEKLKHGDEQKDEANG